MSAGQTSAGTKQVSPVPEDPPGGDEKEDRPGENDSEDSDDVSRVGDIGAGVRTVDLAEDQSELLDAVLQFLDVGVRIRGIARDTPPGFELMLGLGLWGLLIGVIYIRETLRQRRSWRGDG